MSDLRSVPEGDDIVYACRLRYQGTTLEPMVWEGPGVAGGIKTSQRTKIAINNSLNCSYGESRLLVLAYDRHG